MNVSLGHRSDSRFAAIVVSIHASMVTHTIGFGIKTWYNFIDTWCPHETSRLSSTVHIKTEYSLGDSTAWIISFKLGWTNREVNPYEKVTWTSGVGDAYTIKACISRYFFKMGLPLFWTDIKYVCIANIIGSLKVLHLLYFVPCVWQKCWTGRWRSLRPGLGGNPAEWTGSTSHH